jgi:hypothetical protein
VGLLGAEFDDSKRAGPLAADEAKPKSLDAMQGWTQPPTDRAVKRDDSRQISQSRFVTDHGRAKSLVRWVH